jgi:lysophospholipase L1-like esterase
VRHILEFVQGGVGDFLRFVDEMLFTKKAEKLIPHSAVERIVRIIMIPRAHTVLCLAALVSPLQAAENFWDEIPQTPSTTRPAVVLDDYWNSEFQRVNQEIAAAKQTKLILFGDSITWSWSLGPATGRKLWEEHFAPYHPINMGNSGDITPVMLHRVTRGNLDFPVSNQPKVAMMLCGINNFGVTKSADGKETWNLGINCPPADIANGQRAIAQVFRRKLPGTRVIMLALLPVSDVAKWEKVKQVNTIQEAVTRDSNEVTFINLQDRFLKADGTFNKALYTDGTHLNADGYQEWMKGIHDNIKKLTDAPSLAPSKIMFIGGSEVEGQDSSRSYRRYLDGMLRRKGHLIDFVGSRHKHNDDKTEADSYQFDPDHEGHTGKDSAWFAENMPRLLEQNVPDIAVIHLGAEDIASAKSADEPLTDGIIHDIDRVIHALRAKYANVKILVATPISKKGHEETTAVLNRKIQNLAKSSNQPMLVIEAESRPDPDGARKIAETMAEAIQSLSPQSK